MCRPSARVCSAASFDASACRRDRQQAPDPATRLGRLTRSRGFPPRHSSRPPPGSRPPRQALEQEGPRNLVVLNSQDLPLVLHARLRPRPDFLGPAVGLKSRTSQVRLVRERGPPKRATQDRGDICRHTHEEKPQIAEFCTQIFALRRVIRSLWVARRSCLQLRSKESAQALLRRKKRMLLA